MRLWNRKVRYRYHLYRKEDLYISLDALWKARFYTLFYHFQPRRLHSHKYKIYDLSRAGSFYIKYNMLSRLPQQNGYRFLQAFLIYQKNHQEENDHCLTACRPYRLQLILHLKFHHLNHRRRIYQYCLYVSKYLPLS